MSTPSSDDRPIILADLLDPSALADVIASFEGFHGVTIAVIDGRGGVYSGDPGAIPPEVRAARPDPTASSVPVSCACGDRWLASPIVHHGDLLGTVVVGPVVFDADSARMIAHVRRCLDALIKAHVARHLTSQLHLATLADTYEQLADRNARLAHAVERLQDLDRLKSSFLATVSHELRTPLTSVIGYSEMLLEGLAGPLNQEQRDYVSTIMEKGDQLLQLITGILDVSRIEAGTLKIARDPVDLRELIEAAIATIAPQARRKKLTVRVAGSAPRALGDRDKIRQILLNLLGNAIKFTPDGGRVEIEVTVGQIGPEDDGTAVFTPAGGNLAHGSSTPAGDLRRLGVQMRVADSGIGIAPEKQGRIFEPFFQVDSSSTREYGGTGLGLALVKSYVEAHGGRVWVDSDLGRGSVFTVSFPAVEDELSSWLRQRATGTQSDRTSP